MKNLHLLFCLISVLFFLGSCTYETTQTNDRQKITFNEKGDSILNSYSASGKLESSITMKNGTAHGETKYFYPNGNPKIISNYENGKKQGKSIWFHENGKVYQTSFYVKNKLDGVKTVFYENGKVLSESEYKIGKFISSREYKKDGSPKDNSYAIIFTTNDEVAMNGKFELFVKMSQPVRNLKFYEVYTAGGNEIRTPIKMTNGVGKLEYFVLKGNDLMQEVKILAAFNTSRGTKTKVYRTYNLAIEN